jgi:2-iminobutanoate/2-iminopropanoate deaminase
MKEQSRRDLLTNVAAVAVAASGVIVVTPEARAQSGLAWEKKAIHRAPVSSPPNSPTSAPAAPKTSAAPVLFNSIVTFGNLVFLAGIGAHFPGTIEEHTKYVLEQLEQNLILAGSSMEKVLKVNVYLSDLANYAKMNSVYTGRWGNVPPVRTTVAVVAGVPGDSLVEIDCIASI